MARYLEYKKELMIILSGLVCAAIIGFSLPMYSAIGWYAGYFLGIISVAGHLLIVWLIKDNAQKAFMERYYLGIFIRFLITLGLFASLLILTEIEQISFTLSFIISYIFHSGIDIILINKKITNRSSINS